MLERLGRLVTAQVIMAAAAISLSFSFTNTTLLMNGLTRGDWSVAGADFVLSVVMQIVAGMVATASACSWMYELFRSLAIRRRPSREHMQLLLVLTASSVALLFAGHRWFQILLCERGAGPCGF